MPLTFRSYAERVLAAAMKRRGLDRIALCALRKATQLLGLAIGTRLAQMREEGSHTHALFSRSEQDALHLRLLQETSRFSPAGGTRSRIAIGRTTRPNSATASCV